METSESVHAVPGPRGSSGRSDSLESIVSAFAEEEQQFRNAESY